MIPYELKTLKNETVFHTPWEEIHVMMKVYFYATHKGKEYALGPFQVADVKRRFLLSFEVPARILVHKTDDLYTFKGEKDGK